MGIRATTSALEKQQLLHNLYVCLFVTLGIQHASVIFQPVACPALQYFSTYLINGII